MISSGQTFQRATTVNPAQHTFAVQASWDQGDIRLGLTTPSAKVYDRSTTDPAAHHHVQANGESFAIDTPEAGQWTIRLSGGRLNQDQKVRIDISQVPLSSFGPITYVVAEPDRGVAPLTIQLTGSTTTSGGATITSYRWDFGDCSPVESQPTAHHVFKTPGKFTVTLTVTDSNLQSGSASHDVFVTAYKHAPTADFAWGFLDASHPNALLADASSSTDVDGQITSYAWNFGDGSSGTDRGVFHGYLKSGSYALTLTVTDDTGLSASTCQLVTTGQFYGTPVACPA